jgi:hypothetical protein
MQRWKSWAVAAVAVAAAAIVAGTGLVTVGATAAPKSYLATVDVSAQVASTLAPGGHGDLVLRITNSGPQAVAVAEVLPNGPVTANRSGCNASAVSFAGARGLAVVVPRKSGQTPGRVDVTLRGVVAMSNAANDRCQGATFTIPVALSGDPVRG